MTTATDATVGLGQAVQRPLPARPLPARGLPSGPRGPVPVRATNATLIERIDLTDAMAILRVRPDDAPRPFAPGQYFSLGLEIGGRVIQRPYSTASAPGSVELEFLIRRVDGGAFTPALWATRAEERVSLGRAKGVFTLRSADERQPVFIATGTGLAPFVAMLRAGVDRPERAPAVVVHGVAHAGELAYHGELTALADAGRIAYLPVVSRPAHPANTGWTGTVGRVPDTLAAIVAQGTFDPAACVAYLCGNPGMIGSASAVLAALGVPPEAIVTERYWDASGT
jgi:ferredoxin-NADP reductase